MASLVAIPFVLSGCGFVADDPPRTPPAAGSPAVVSENAAAKAVTGIAIPKLNQDGFDRRAQSISVRLRNTSCEGVSTGSGWALDSHTLVTNRHVVTGADQIDVETADGRTLHVSAAQAGVLGDIAFVKVKETLPVIAVMGPAVKAGAEVAAVGYPEGGPFTITHGVVVDSVDGNGLGIPGRVLRISAEVRPGNSGGPLLDARGRVVGVVYAIEISTGLGLAMPMTTVNSLITSGGFESVPPCGAGE